MDNYQWHKVSAFGWAIVALLALALFPWWAAALFVVLAGLNLIFLLLFATLPSYPVTAKAGTAVHAFIFVSMPMIIVSFFIWKVMGNE